MTLHIQSVDPSPTVEEAVVRYLAELRTHIYAATERYADAPATHVHDQGTFTTGWEPYIRITGDPTALQFMQQLRDKIRDHYVTTGLWRHGYWTMQEAHHGTEHHELFLGALWRLAPNDDATIAQLVDAAEHLGNWSTAVPPWFDWAQQRYCSFFFGADGVRLEPGAELNVPDHLRCVNIALLAHAATGEQRYLDLAATYGTVWADAILAKETLPIGLLPGRVVYTFTPEEEAVYRKRVGQGSPLLSPVDRAESFLASDGINMLLALWQQTQQLLFLQAAQRLLDALITNLADPDAGAVADAVRHYRQWTGDSRYDAAVLATLAEADPFAIHAIGFAPDERVSYRPSGVGKRTDMICWQEDGQPRRHNPITLALAAELTNDEALASRALDLARTYTALASRVLPDGRDHGCAARTVNAVLRGHGRENHAGMTTAVLQPLFDAFCTSS